MMHIISTVSGKSCKLLPLIKFGESPHKANNACISITGELMFSHKNGFIIRIKINLKDPLVPKK